MTQDQSIIDTFFEECEDLLTSLTDDLAAMCDGAGDDEMIHAIFRAVHSIKGAAGAFAFDDLVTFAHRFETVLDAVRSDQIDAKPDLLRVLQRSGDMLADLVDAARDDRTSDQTAMHGALDELQAFLPNITEPVEDFTFEAISLDFDEPSDATFIITFTPTKDFYAHGNDPLFIINALAELGDIDVQADFNGAPDDFADFHWDHGYLTWNVTLTGDVTDLTIRDIFQFVDDLCDLQISAQDTAPDVVIDLPPPQTTPKENKPKRAVPMLRVEADRVDRLINAVGELIINQSVISQRVAEAMLSNATQLQSDLDDYRLLAREIQEGVMAIRAQPVKPLFQRMLRIARDAADSTGKQVETETIGEDTEVDKTLVEKLAEPLTHMIRNAIDHGIETPDARMQAGKDVVGKLRLSASQQSGSIIIKIIDDGAGLNRPYIRSSAIKKGLISPDASLSDQEIDHLLFAPGFSTAAAVTNLSGRGVGMDVVKTTITDLGGRIEIDSITGKGTTFSIILPLTLAVMDGMIITINGQMMVLPISSILETIRPVAQNISALDPATDLLRIRDDYVPIIDLAKQLGHKSDEKALTDRVMLLICTQKSTQYALAVDDIIDQRQIVVKSMQENYGKIAHVSGATILGDGKIALILDPDTIISTAPSHFDLPMTPQEGDTYASA